MSQESSKSARRIPVLRAAFLGLIVSGIAILADTQVNADLSSDESRTVFTAFMGLVAPPFLFAFVAYLINIALRRHSKRAGV